MTRLLLVFIVSIFYVIAFSQEISIDKSAICKVLVKEHKCKVIVGDVSKKNNETITTWGYRQGYTSKPLVARGCCICIHYYVEKDAGGSSYYRDLFIPIDYVTKKNLEKSDFVYYMDRWAGKGCRFDSQGGSFAVNDVVRQIVKLINLHK